VFEWANRTRTVGGGRLLRERFRSPPASAREIERTQGAVAWLVANPGCLEPILDRAAWLSIERYTSSVIGKLDHPNALFRWIDSWWLRAADGDLYREVQASLALAQKLARTATRVMNSMTVAELPGRLREWRAAMLETLAAPPFQRMVSGPLVHRLWSPALIRLDSAFRGEGFEPLTRLAGLVYEIDCLGSLAEATREHGLVIPHVVEGSAPQFVADGLWHPLLDRPVPNAVRLDPETRVLFVTGPNMAGKSTYLRAAGIAAHLAHLGMGVPARSLRLVPFRCLFAGIETADDIRLGQSYFAREVQRVREIADLLATHAPALVVFDEMFRGTNLKDASDATLAVLDGFSACDRCAFLIASHIAELAEPVRRLDGVGFLHFAATLGDGRPCFDFRIRPGVSEQRLGMVILERAGVLSRLAALRRPPASA
jgi:DNA mismatch repair protein MutS